MSLLRFAACLWSLCFAAITWAGELKTLDLHEAGQYSLGNYSYWLEDSDANLSPMEVLKADTWQKSTGSGFNFGFSDSAFWIKTPLTNTRSLDWSYWIRYSLLDNVDLWVCPANVTHIDACQHMQSGDSLPFPYQRSYDHPNIIFPLALEPETDYILLLRSKTIGTQLIPASIIDRGSLKTELLTESLLRGAYYATMLVIGIYNLLIFAFTRDRSYLSYAAFVGAMMLFHVVYDGVAFQMLWPQTPIINRYALPVALAITILTLSFFVPQFLNLNRKNSSVFRLFRAYIAIALVCLAMQPLLSYEFLLEALNLLVLIITLTALITGLYFWRQGHKPARFFTIAWLALTIGVLSSTARSFGWGPTDLFTLYGYQIGSFLQVILMSLALAERIMQLQKDSLNARKELLDSQEASIKNLRDYEELYQNAISGQFQLDKDGYFIRTNTSWRAMLGYTDRNYFNNDNPRFNSLFADAKQRKALWKELHEQGRIRAWVVTLIQPITEERIVVSLTIRKSSNGVTAWYGSGTDVTDNYLKEKALIQQHQEKNQALRQLVQGIAQEMAGPILKLQEADALLQSNASNEQHYEDINKGRDKVHTSLERLNELHQLMQSSLVQTRLYPADDIRLRDWLDQWRTDTLSTHTLNLQVAVHSYLIEWRTHPEALRLVLNQLIDNSCAHNTKLFDSGDLKVMVEFRERGEFLELHYRDNGKGVPPDQRHAIFMPFYTTQKNDTKHKGLGLYQAYSLLTELMLGHLEWGSGNTGFSIVVRFNLPQFDKKDEKE